MKGPQSICIILVTCLAAGCMTFGNASKPIESIKVPSTAAGADHPLVIVLPGIGGDARQLNEHRIGDAVHRNWPEADVLLTSATLAYYREGNILTRMEQDLIEPARRQGYTQIWLAGASMGSMGVLYYEHEHPGQLAGVILLAPWLGSPKLQNKIRDAGGLRQWDPGPLPDRIGRDNYQLEMWRVAKDWSSHPDAARRVWLVIGTEDRLLDSGRLLATALPADHFLSVPGGHSWDTFIAAAEKVAGEIEATLDRPRPARRAAGDLTVAR